MPCKCNSKISPVLISSYNNHELKTIMYKISYLVLIVGGQSLATIKWLHFSGEIFHDTVYIPHNYKHTIGRLIYPSQSDWPLHPLQQSLPWARHSWCHHEGVWNSSHRMHHHMPNREIKFHPEWTNGPSLPKCYNVWIVWFSKKILANLVIMQILQYQSAVSKL